MPAAPSPRPAGILKQDSQECVSPSSYLGLSYSLSPRSTPKSVTIAPHAETISPLMLGKQKSVDEFDLEKSPRRLKVKGPNARRMSGRLAFPSTSSLRSFPSLQSLSASLDGTAHSEDAGSEQQHLQGHNRVNTLIAQVGDWIKEEKAKRKKRKSKKKSRRATSSIKEEQEGSGGDEGQSAPRHDSETSEDSLDLSKLEIIIKQGLTLQSRPGSRQGSAVPRRKSSMKKLHTHGRKPSAVSSDTEYFEGDVNVPSCDVVLDNSKTLGYSGGGSGSTTDLTEDDKTAARDKDGWKSFKFEIVRLAHTLRLKGWRRVPMDLCSEIDVARLSGALTNAVYVVSPPNDLPTPQAHREGGNGSVVPPKAPPPKLLLRIYGPQVEHLIDREEELQILRRLARKKIGPRMLGTFANGRFEEFFNARTLTAEDLRNPETSKQIAKRMRELHEGIELLDQERDDGPFVWRNWDKWVQRVEEVVSWMDHEVQAHPIGDNPTGPDAWKRRGLICGVEWRDFRKTVEKYRKWLDAQYGGSRNVEDQLVFAHNDTQYGNILRLMPSGESPLLLPSNTHKQLVVIDFEYANANLPGLEFANHFTEWCYNYHNEIKPYALHPEAYPTPEEQDRFVRAYVRHRPQLNISTPKLAAQTPPIGSTTPASTAPLQRPGPPSSSISNFMLDARNPYFPSQPQQYDEAAEDSAEDAEVARLLHETRLWRLANTAQWVAWGIVQAKVPGMPSFSPPASGKLEPVKLEEPAREELGERAEGYREMAEEQSDGEKDAEKDAEEEFDYLGYAQHRAMFFWGDAVQMGIVKLEDLPEDTREKIKTISY